MTNKINTLLQTLFPICRSITGDGNRKTLHHIKKIIPINILEYPSGEDVYDWKIPAEWNIRDAWIKNSKGEKIVDFKISNIHVVSYSEPIDKTISFIELKKYLYFKEDLPDAIPYRTSYYNRTWGFCVSYNQFQSLFKDGESYHVYIDSNFNKNGSLTIGELIIKGTSETELLISTYICHPSLANDNLSGIVLTTFLAEWLLSRNNFYTYRIIFIPETIGAISYLKFNEEKMKQIKSGFVITTVGGQGKLGYKQSYNSEHFLNKCAENCLKKVEPSFKHYPFDIFGSDERQFSSVGFRINTISITKDKYYDYPFYHTSLDNLDFISAVNIEKTLNVHKECITFLEINRTYMNTVSNGEVMLSKHDLYPKNGGAFLPSEKVTELELIQWILFYSDGRTPLVDISEKLECKLESLFSIAEKLVIKGILKTV